MPPPTVPTSRPPKRIVACRPALDTARRAVRHRARADHAEILPRGREDRSDRRGGGERHRLHPARDRAMGAGPRQRLQILGRRPEHAPDLLVREERLGQHRLAVPGLEVLGGRLLVAAHVRLEDRALRLDRRPLHHVRHVQRVGVARHHVRADGVAGRPLPEHVAHRADDVRLRAAKLRALRERRGRRADSRNARMLGSSASTHFASATASPAFRQTKQDARVMRSCRT